MTDANDMSRYERPRFRWGWAIATILGGVLAGRLLYMRLTRVEGQTAVWRGDHLDGNIRDPENETIVAWMYRGLGHKMTVPWGTPGVRWEVFTLPPPGERPWPLARDVPSLKPPWPWKVEILGSGNVPADGPDVKNTEAQHYKAARKFIDDYIASGGRVPQPGETL